MGNVIRYEHYGAVVAVDEDLQGKHREMCLCSRCGWFNPEDRDKNCVIANEIFAYCVAHNTVTPVFECPEFEETER